MTSQRTRLSLTRASLLPGALALVLVFGLGACAKVRPVQGRPLRCVERFRYQDFPIGIWRTPPVRGTQPGMSQRIQLSAIGRSLS